MDEATKMILFDGSVDDDEFPQWTNAPTLDDLLAAVRSLYYDAEAEIEEVEDLDMTDLWETRKTIVGIAQAVKTLRDLVDAELGNALPENGSARLDDYHVKVQPSRRLKVSDPVGFKEWVGEDWDQVINITAATVRTKALKEVAKARGEDPDGAIDTFCEYVEGTPKLSTIPLDKAPKFVADMEHGDVRE